MIIIGADLTELEGFAFVRKDGKEFLVISNNIPDTRKAEILQEYGKDPELDIIIPFENYINNDKHSIAIQ